MKVKDLEKINNKVREKNPKDKRYLEIEYFGTEGIKYRYEGDKEFKDIKDLL